MMMRDDNFPDKCSGEIMKQIKANYVIFYQNERKKKVCHALSTPVLLNNAAP